MFELKYGLPGLGSGVIGYNGAPAYRQEGEYSSGRKPANTDQDKFSVVADISSSFTVLVGIFFPSVTGIMASCNLSGRLKDPIRSIPQGTIASVITMTIVYLTAVLLMGGVATQAVLSGKYVKALAISCLLPALAGVILLGALISTFGSAIQSLMGGPPVLRAIAVDNIIPVLAPFAKL